MQIRTSKRRGNFPVKIPLEPQERTRKRICDHSYSIKSLHDLDMKTRAVDLLAASIPSIDRTIFESYILSDMAKERHIHTWAILENGRDAGMISVVVFRKHCPVSIIELMWVATHEPYRSDGFGSEIIDRMAEDWYKLGVGDYVLTHADISAVGFFRRLGFQEFVPFPRDLSDPWIDKYSQSQLMCLSLMKFDPAEDYEASNLPLQILVFVDNVDRSAAHIWVDAIVLKDFQQRVLVQYSYMQRIYHEILPCVSRRLKFNFSSVC
jgi:N-acetylglutamate synthase-like GNAT family acetyltransferase